MDSRHRNRKTDRELVEARLGLVDQPVSPPEKEEVKPEILSVRVSLDPVAIKAALRMQAALLGRRARREVLAMKVIARLQARILSIFEASHMIAR